MNKIVSISMLLIFSMFLHAADHSNSPQGGSSGAASSSSSARSKPISKMHAVLQKLGLQKKIAIELDFADALEEIVDQLPDEKVDLLVALLVELSKDDAALNSDHLKKAISILNINPGLDPAKVGVETLPSIASEDHSRLWNNTKKMVLLTGATVIASFAVTKAAVYYSANR